MIILFEVDAVFFVGIAPYIVGSIQHLRHPERPLTGTPSDRLLNRWLRAIAGIAVVGLVALDQPGALGSIGIYLGSSKNIAAVSYGLIAIAGVIVILMAINAIPRLIRKPGASTPPAAKPHLTEVNLYRDIWDRLAFLAVLPFEVIAEDMVYRGYLVLLWGTRTGTFIPWIILSIALSVVLHLYQGLQLRMIIFHVLAAGLFIALLLTTHNLLAAIVPHLYYDFLWATGAWRRAARAKEETARPVKRTEQKLGYLAFIGGNALVLLLFAFVYFAY